MRGGQLLGYFDGGVGCSGAGLPWCFGGGFASPLCFDSMITVPPGSGG